MTLFLVILSCARPPQAPEDLDSLAAWLWARHDDDVAVEEGLANLHAWMEQSGPELFEGVELTGLVEADIASLDDREHSLEGVLGVAVALESQHSVEAWVDALLVRDQAEILPGHYQSYERTWETDRDCFVAGTCERALSREELEAKLPLGVVATNPTTNTYLWADSPLGPAVVQRSWLPEPGEISLSDWVIQDQYYLNVLLARGGGSWRIQATWMVHDQSLFSESGLLSFGADGMIDLAEDTETWLDDSVR